MINEKILKSVRDQVELTPLFLSSNILILVNDFMFIRDMHKTLREENWQRRIVSVYKSKNVLDDQFYAVKKIKLKIKDMKTKMEEEIEPVLQEVKVLAKVNHQNILRIITAGLMFIQGRV